MTSITLRLKDGDIEGEVTLNEGQGQVLYDAAKALLFAIMERSTLTAKDALIQMAQKKEVRPLRMTNLGECLCIYTNKNHGEYDAVFDEEMRALVPDWFVD